MLVGRLLSFWDGIFSGAILNFQGVKEKCQQFSAQKKTTLPKVFFSKMPWFLKFLNVCVTSLSITWPTFLGSKFTKVLMILFTFPRRWHRSCFGWLDGGWKRFPMIGRNCFGIIKCFCSIDMWYVNGEWWPALSCWVRINVTTSGFIGVKLPWLTLELPGRSLYRP